MYRPRTGGFISQKLSTHPSGPTIFLKMKCNYLVLSFTNVGQIRGKKGGGANYSQPNSNYLLIYSKWIIIKNNTKLTLTQPEMLATRMGESWTH